jgi:hypothetical protein
MKTEITVSYVTFILKTDKSWKKKMGRIYIET